MSLIAGALRLVSMAALWLAVLLAAANAAPVRSENVEAELHATHASVGPGERFTLAVRLKMREGWHTYWRNPGDAGEPTRIVSWALPDGFSPGDIQWPLPSAFSAGTPDFPITSYGYGEEVLLPIEVSAPPALAPGDGRIALTVSWLECADVCIPEQKVLELPLGLGVSELDHVWAARIGESLAAVPHQEAAQARVTPGDRPVLTARVERWAGSALRNPRFFPFESDRLEHSVAGDWAAPADGSVGLRLQAQANAATPSGPLEGVLVVERRDAKGDWVAEGVEISALPGEPLFQIADFSAERPTEGGQARAGEGGQGLDVWAALGFAFLGGLILNLMPCVFPVLSVKALSFASTPADHVRRHGAFFLFGVMATFLALAGLLIALQGAGAALGWGFQLQQPAVVAALILVFFTLGLNLLGAFEMGAAWQSLGSGLAGRAGDAGAFFTGALAVVAASPCTAPFMGAALGFAATQPAAISLSVFAALGMGFAAPFVALAFLPGARSLLPKPGAWMERFKEILAFPMFATAIYLVWVLAQQVDAASLVVVLAGALGIGAAVWAARFAPQTGVAAGLAAVGAVIWALAGAGSNPAAGVQTAQAQGVDAQSQAYQPWSEQAVADARRQGRPVFVNFTAAWCVTCKVNEALVLSRPEVQAALSNAGALALKGDWTKQDAVIAAELGRHGRQGVPLYLLYLPGRDAPLVLPQQLTRESLLEPLQAAGGA